MCTCILEGLHAYCQIHMKPCSWKKGNEEGKRRLVPRNEFMFILAGSKGARGCVLLVLAQTVSADINLVYSFLVCRGRKWSVADVITLVNLAINHWISCNPKRSIVGFDIDWAKPHDLASNSLQIYSRKVLLVQLPACWIVRASWLLIYNAMAPPALSKWEPTLFGS